jgi:hypothetical protein
MPSVLPRRRSRPRHAPPLFLGRRRSSALLWSPSGFSADSQPAQRLHRPLCSPAARPACRPLKGALNSLRSMMTPVKVVQCASTGQAAGARAAARRTTPIRKGEG